MFFQTHPWAPAVLVDELYPSHFQGTPNCQVIHSRQGRGTVALKAAETDATKRAHAELSGQPTLDLERIHWSGR